MKIPFWTKRPATPKGRGSLFRTRRLQRTSRSTITMVCSSSGKKEEGKTSAEWRSWARWTVIFPVGHCRCSRPMAQRFLSPRSLLPRGILPPHPPQGQRKVFSGFLPLTWEKVFLSCPPACLSSRICLLIFVSAPSGDAQRTWPSLSCPWDGAGLPAGCAAGGPLSPGPTQGSPHSSPPASCDTTTHGASSRQQLGPAGVWRRAGQEA